MMARMRAFTSRSAVTSEDTRAGLAVYGHEPEALVVVGELRAAVGSARPRYVVAALGATMVLMLVTVVVPSDLAALIDGRIPARRALVRPSGRVG